MEDTLVIGLVMHILTFFVVDYLDYHGFAEESMIAVINTLLLMYFHKRKKK